MRRCRCSSHSLGELGRGWVWLDENAAPSPEESEELDERVEELNALAERWSALAAEIEQRGFKRQLESDDDLPQGPDFESEMDSDIYEYQKELRERLDIARLADIEDKLHQRGARMMRPYEHHNEDERYMEYMERDREDY